MSASGPAQLAHRALSVEVGQWRPVQFLVLDIGPQPDHQLLHGEAGSAGLVPKSRAAARDSANASASVRPPRRSPHLAPGHHVHPGQQVAKASPTGP